MDPTAFLAEILKEDGPEWVLIFTLLWALFVQVRADLKWRQEDTAVKAKIAEAVRTLRRENTELKRQIEMMREQLRSRSG